MLFSSIATALTAATATAATATAASTVAVPTAIHGAATVAGLIGTGVGVVTQMEGQRQLSAASKRAEEIRERQAALQSLRERREVIRKAQAARAASLATLTTSGATEGSSAAGGAFGQIGADSARSINASFGNQTLGAEYFDTQRTMASARTTTAFGAGIADLGKQTVASSEQIGKIGASLWGTS